jgi:chemotaxis protein MotA
MDIATIIGFVAVFGLIISALGDPAPFIDPPSILIVVGGTAATVLARSTFPEYIGAIKVAMKTVKYKVDKPEDLIEQLVNLGTIARKDGMIALEGQDIPNEFMAKGIRMLVDGTEGSLIKSEQEMLSNRNSSGIAFFDSVKEIAPAMGMIGTLVGLVIMLGNMSDPKSIGPAFAVALLTTMYGAIIANIICIPIIQKLQKLEAAESLNHDLILQGVMFIQGGGNPRMLTDLLISFVDPKERSKLEAAAA